MNILQLLSTDTKKKKQYIKEFDTLRLKPFVNIDNGFTDEYCKKVIENIHYSQYNGNSDKFSLEFYRNMNILLYGCYVAGLQDSKELDDSEIDQHSYNLENQINILF